jgi:hypothetical protein
MDDLHTFTHSGDSAIDRLYPHVRPWQQNLNYFQATDYLQSVLKQAMDAEKKGNVIDVGGLPVP